MIKTRDEKIHLKLRSVANFVAFDGFVATSKRFESKVKKFHKGTKCSRIPRNVPQTIFTDRKKRIEIIVMFALQLLFVDVVVVVCCNAIKCSVHILPINLSGETTFFSTSLMGWLKSPHAHRTRYYFIYRIGCALFSSFLFLNTLVSLLNDKKVM